MLSEFQVEDFWGKALHVSNHAAERFLERFSGDLPKDPEKTLRLFLRLALISDSIDSTSRTIRMIDHEMEEVEYWDLKNGLRAVTLDKGDHRVVLTIEHQQK